MITGIYKFWFFWSKIGRFVTHNCFPKKKTWNPYFYSVLGVQAFWAKMSKKGNFEKPPKKRKNLTDNWKAIFWCFCCCFFGLLFFLFFSGSFVCFFFVFFFFLVFFVGGFKGQVRWPKGPPHLALNPPYFFCFVFAFLFFVLFFLFVLEGLRVRWGGPKGHLTWP